ncbi:hypothetical protein, partial [Pseudomonas sp. PDM13]|uniref:hypothetical protein n=1 Tax=Pseudomonas sp. PDM13 TaxID=2769255 RepID=UPI0021E0349C
MHTVTYNIAPTDTPYTYQEDTKDHKKGDTVPSRAGHMWYTIQDKDGNTLSYGFQSNNNSHGLYPWQENNGKISTIDNVAYGKGVQSITISITEEQYNKLKSFGETPSSYNFNDKEYNILTNSCVDFTYASMSIAGIDLSNDEGNLYPENNVSSLQNWLEKNLKENSDRIAFWDSGTSCTINPVVNSSFDAANSFIERRDPLSLDLDGDGIETVGANAGITFDF